MASPTIKIDQAGQAAGVAGQSRSNLVTGSLVTLSDPANPVGVFLWELVPPVGSAAVLNSTSVASPTFTPDIAGTYLIYVTVSGVEKSFTLDANGEKVSSQGGAAVLLANGTRLIGIKETKQFGTTGWAAADDAFRRNLPFKQSGSTLIRTTDEKLKEIPSINDFLPTGASNDWRSALVAALAEFSITGGGTLRFPRRATTYDFDNTGLGPISWTPHGVWLVGDGATSSKLRNVSTDGTNWINFSGGSKQRLGFRNFKIDSLSTAGHVWGFDTTGDGISFSRWENLWIIQRAVTKAIIYGRFIDTDPNNPGGGGGMFENQFVGGVYEHGTGSGSSGTIVPATVSAFDLEATLSLIVLNKWEDIRVNCHGSLAPFWHLHNTDNGIGNKKYIHQNEWRGINCELVRRGLIRLRGHAGGRISDITYYDLGLNGNVDAAGVDGNLIDIGVGSGGRYSQHTIIEGVQRNGAGHLTAAAESIVNVFTLSQAAGVATCTTTAAHGYTTGDLVSVDGSTIPAYNGRKSITVTGSNTFTFTIDSGTSNPAAGVMYTSRIGRPVTITQTGGVATLTRTAHGFVAGQRIWIQGADQSSYNGRFTILTATPNTLTFAVLNNPASPATGTITVAEGAFDFKLASGNECDQLIACQSMGGSDTAEADIVGSSAIVSGHSLGSTNALLVVRPNTLGVQIEVGSTSSATVSALRVAEITSPDGPVVFPFGFTAVDPADWPITVPRDGPTQSSGIQAATPSTSLQWQKCEWPVPDSLWEMQETSGTTLADNMLNSVLLNVNGTVSFAQTISGWSRKAIQLTATAGESLTHEDNTYSPVTKSVAALGYFKIGAVASGSRTLMNLGTTSIGVGAGGYFVRLISTGQLVLRADGVDYQGTTVYESDGLVHPILLILDQSTSQIILRTDTEEIVGVLTGNINTGTMGFGGVGAQTPPDTLDILMGAWFYDEKAEQINALGKNALAKLGWYAEIPTPGPRKYEPNGIDGLRLSWTSVSQVTAAVGGCRSSDDSIDITSTISLMADITVSGAGGRDTGAEAANTWYGVYIVGDSTGSNNAALLLSTNATAPTLPAGYDKKRLIGWVRNDASSNFRHFYQRKEGRMRTYFWDEARGTTLDGLNALHKTGGATDIAYADVDLSGLVPPNCDLARVMVAFQATAAGGAAGDTLELRPKGANSSNGPYQFSAGATTAAVMSGMTVEIPTDANRFIQYKATDIDDVVDLWVLGFDQRL